MSIMLPHSGVVGAPSPVAWEVPLSPTSSISHSSRLGRKRFPPWRGEPLMPSSQKHGSITTRSVFEKERHAEERRRQQMEARRERLREHMTHVKTVALEHATRMKDEVTRLGMEIARKQAEAAARRKALFEEGRRRSSQRTAIVPSTTVESSLLVTHGKKVSETEEIKSLKAKWRACQRLVCVVAKSRLHNAKAKQLALRARSAKIIQRRWRSTLERIRMVREMFFNKENIAALEFWRSSDSMLGNKASFEDVMAFMNDARSVRAVDVLLLSEILSLMERKRSILVFTSKRLLRITWLLSDQLLVLASEKNPVLPLLEQLQRFLVALEAFSVLFRSMKEEDAEALAEDMFDGIVSIRVQLEELRDRGSSDGADRIQFLEKFFFESIGKVKRLLHRQQHPDKYKRFLERVSREVRRRRDDLNLVRRVAAQPDTAKLPSSKPREGNQMTLEKFSDLSNSEFVIVVVNGLNDIKRRLKEITPNRVDPDLDAGVDVKLIRQQLEHGAFDFPRDFIVLARFIGGKICFLSEPDRAEALTRWMDETFTTGEGDGRPWKVRKLVFSTFERLFQSLSEIEHDVANFHLQALKTVINTTTSPEGESIVQAHVRGSNVGRVPALLRWIGPSVDDTDVDPLALFPKILAQNLVDHHEFIPAAEDAFDSFEAKQLAEIHSLAIRTLRVAYNQLIWRQVVVGGEGKFSVKFTFEVEGKFSLDIASVDELVAQARSLRDPAVSPDALALLQRLLAAFDASPTSSGSEGPALKQLLRRRLQVSLEKGNKETFIQQCSASGSKDFHREGFESMVGELHDRFSRIVSLIVLSRRAPSSPSTTS